MAKKTNRANTAKKWTFVALVVFLLIALIGGTYTRYTSTASGTGTAQVAKWAVKINDTNIVSNDTFTLTFNEVENNDVVDGKIAPSSTLYADFVVDPTGSEVAVDYSFSLSNITASAGSVPSDIAVSSVVASTGTSNAVTLTNSGSTYSGTIGLASQNAALTSSEAVTVRVYVTWTNTEANNANHTAAGVATPTLSMTVTGTARQHITE